MEAAVELLEGFLQTEPSGIWTYRHQERPAERFGRLLELAQTSWRQFSGRNVHELMPTCPSLHREPELEALRMVEVEGVEY